MRDSMRDLEGISREDFVFAAEDPAPQKEKRTKKHSGYFTDALARFRKNKSSVAAAWILGFLFVFAMISPIVSPYVHIGTQRKEGKTRWQIVLDKDAQYVNYPPFVPAAAVRNLGFLDGGVIHESQSEGQMLYWRGIARETGMDPVIRVVRTHEIVSQYRGEERVRVTYTLKTNKYYETGIRYMTLSLEEFANIQRFQNESGIQVIYPAVDPDLIFGLEDRPNIWYRLSDTKGTPLLDEAGQFIPAYETDPERAGAEYDSLRIPGDDGSYIYSTKKSGAVRCRICYYNYYIYKNGREPSYIFGTNVMGQDLFGAVGVGGSFSLLFALAVSAINLFVGAVYGAVQGYYGGVADLVMDRITDILSGVPFTVVAALFQLHLAQRVGIVPSFLFAFVLTGWIGIASLTRKQFYRFKGREYVLAARTLGASDRRLMFRHIFPNSLGTLVTACALVIPTTISAETTLSYLGIVNLSDLVGTSLGTLLSQWQTAMTTSPHAMLFPALFFSLLLISFNLFGNGLRDAFNPSTRGEEG